MNLRLALDELGVSPREATALQSVAVRERARPALMKEMTNGAGHRLADC
ncbi:MAG: hypothetical protein JNL38_01040 [Myxococcales bacterium]|nr:hypothetical protein [Myxococcales bacterium]